MFETLRLPEIDFLGLYLPWAFVMGVAGFLVAWGLTLFLESLGWTRWIWHLPLFFIALAVLCGSLIGHFLAP